MWISIWAMRRLQERSEDDYGFDVDCGMGDIKIGNHHYSGFGDSSSWNIDKKNQIEISCDMGNITVTFDK